ncbi:MAG TPA: PQQ-dependent sugar dehydrogenase [Sphingomicrobium sp.]|nr:PQQ-dependent sugar dehydrogenase [Sphingomicrobium sp.]
MSRRVLQAMLLAAMSASCQSEGSAQPETNGERPFKVSEIADFDTPWAMEFLPGSGVQLTNLALLTEKEGRLWLVDVTSGQRTAVSGVPEVKAAGQGGLGDVMPHLDFAGNRRVYLSYVEGGPNGTSGAALGYGTLDLSNATAPAIRDFKVIWRQEPKVSGNGHFSHRIAFGPDGFLYLSSGDRQKMAPAQDLSNSLGKVLRMTAEGHPADGNPFNNPLALINRDTAIWSYGHRNVLGLQFAPDGRLWASEMGPQGGDEINLILPGKNYGWPRASNGSHYGGEDIPDHQPGDGFEAPKIWWTPSISPGALLIYTGDKFPQWKGDALIGALSGEALIRIDIDGDKASKADHWPMNARIRAIDQGPDGSIYLLEDGNSGGRLLRLDPATAP